MSKMIFNFESEEYDIHIKNVNAEEKDFINFRNQSLTKLVLVGIGQSTYKFNDKVRDVHELHSKYKGQTHIIRPFVYDNSLSYTIRFTKDDECPLGFAVISKRDLRMEYPLLRRAPSEKVKKEAINQMKNDICLYNAMCVGLLYDYHIRYKGKEFTDRVIACTNEELYNKIITKLPFIDDKFDNDFKGLIGEGQ